MVIDQSGRVEETNRSTIVALADKDREFTTELPAKVKIELLNIYRKLGKPKTFPIIVFSQLVFMTMLRFKLFPKILIIDIEYPSHENTIKNIIITLCKRFKKIAPEIYFSNIGKKDPAHISAWRTYTKSRKPNVILKIEDFNGYVSTRKR